MRLKFLLLNHQIDVYKGKSELVRSAVLLLTLESLVLICPLNRKPCSMKLPCHISAQWQQLPPQLILFSSPNPSQICTVSPKLVNLSVLSQAEDLAPLRPTQYGLALAPPCKVHMYNAYGIGGGDQCFSFKENLFVSLSM